MLPQQHVASSQEIRLGHDPRLDAWILHFLTENNLDHATSPDKNASPEQIRFMVDLDEDQFFPACTDSMLSHLLKHEIAPELRVEYTKHWRSIFRLIQDQIADPYLRRKITALCRYKFRSALHSSIVIPSRLLKWMLTIYMSYSGLDDPLRDQKRRANARAYAFTQTALYRQITSACPGELIACTSMEQLREDLDLLELKRLVRLATLCGIWEAKEFRLHKTVAEWSDVIPVWESKEIQPDAQALVDEMDAPWPEFEKLREYLFQKRHDALKILYLPGESGAVIFDILIVRSLIRQGHRVILALREGFDFMMPTIWDQDNDPVLAECLDGAYFLTDTQVSKNELLKRIRENQLLVISDGTRERLNLYRTSLTFARAWKESHLIMANGASNYRRLIAVNQGFTRDIVSFHRNEQKEMHFYCKSRSERIRHVTERELLLMAEKLIESMRLARAEGKTVIFYSAIIGSIPGQTKVAISVLNTFVSYLRSRLEQCLIINPAEHFRPGMDGDDLMYMWEKVQRSGFIDVWRFQTVEDIERSFELLGQKMPAVWNGKDATYSTGCTKEMTIALDMQKKHPELQIIGPDPAKFFRRREYGVGKYFDISLERNWR
ncbi:ARMT1-like domain-containing protein [Desulfonatronum parangueonense]